jgi:hypothetical protein
MISEILSTLDVAEVYSAVLPTILASSVRARAVIPLRHRTYRWGSRRSQGDTSWRIHHRRRGVEPGSHCQ